MGSFLLLFLKKKRFLKVAWLIGGKDALRSLDSRPSIR
jgi:hypothetical protein